jgi:hypothetical protein
VRGVGFLVRKEFGARGPPHLRRRGGPRSYSAGQLPSSRHSLPAWWGAYDDGRATNLLVGSCERRSEVQLGNVRASPSTFSDEERRRVGREAWRFLVTVRKEF